MQRKTGRLLWFKMERRTSNCIGLWRTDPRETPLLWSIINYEQCFSWPETTRFAQPSSLQHYGRLAYSKHGTEQKHSLALPDPPLSQLDSIPWRNA